MILFINIYLIFDISDLKEVAIAIANAHIACTVLWIVEYYLNFFVVDIEAFEDYKARNRIVIIATNFTQHVIVQLTRTWHFLNFWCVSRPGYLAVYLLFSFLGSFVSMKFFAFHLFDICLRVPTLGFVTASIFINIPKLVAAFVLLFLMIYGWMLIGQSAYLGEYGFNDGTVECDAESG